MRPPMDTPHTLANLRQRIRDTDAQLMALIAERLRVARAIGECKRALGLPVKDFEVEKEVVQRNQATARTLGVDERFAETLTQMLIDHARKAQDKPQPELPPKSR